MTKLQAKLYGPRCLCTKHRSMAIGFEYPCPTMLRGKLKGKSVIHVSWNGKIVKTFIGHLGCVEGHARWADRYLPVSPVCIMTLKEERRGKTKKAKVNRLSSSRMGC